MSRLSKAEWQENYLNAFAEFLSDSLTFDPASACEYWSLVKLAKDFNFNLDALLFVIKLFLANVM